VARQWSEGGQGGSGPGSSFRCCIALGRSA